MVNTYKTLNHGKFLLQYHIIFTCKYRKKLLIRFGNEVKDIFRQIEERYDFTIREMEIDKDHIHFLIESIPKVSPLQIIRMMKQISTVEIWKRHKEELRKEFWKENTFWTNGYFVNTIGNISSEKIKEYIENQGR